MAKEPMYCTVCGLEVERHFELVCTCKAILHPGCLGRHGCSDPHQPPRIKKKGGYRPRLLNPPPPGRWRR
jgi:hypothetical protein